MRSFAILSLALIACAEVPPEPSPIAPTTKPPATQPHGTDPHTTSEDGELPCAIEKLAKSRCQGCHGDPLQYGAPVPLLTVKDFQAVDGASTIGAKALKYVKGSGKIMPPAPNERASADEIAALEEWIDADMPARTAGESCEQHGPPPTTGPTGPTNNLTCDESAKLAPTSKHTVTTSSTDSFVCYGMDLPADPAKRHITSVMPLVDNSAVLHHIIVFVTDTKVSGTPAACPAMGQDWRMLTGWAPGSPGGIFPPEAGFPIAAGDAAHLVVQLHYSNPSHTANQKDGSGFELCMTKTLRDNDADLMLFGGTNFSIGAGKKVRMTCEATVPTQLAPYMPVNLFSTFPHMHKLGTRQKIEIIPKTGAVKTLVEVQPWDFNNQISYSADATLKVNDKVRLTCEWENTTANTVGYGEETAEEMCFNFLSYYPMIDNPQWSYLAPLTISTCNTTPL